MTTLGQISNRWSVKRLADVFQTQLGKMLSERARAGTNPKPYLRNANVQWERADLSNVYVMDFTEEEQRKFALKSGDLLMCEGGEIGRTCLWRGELFECFFQKAIHRLRPRSTDVFPEFYLFWLEWAFRYANLYGVTGTQTTIAHLPQEKLEELRIPVPSVSEQRAIADVLRVVQKAVEARRRELALERERKAALMEFLFRKGTHRSATKQTEIGEIPESWSVVDFIDAVNKIEYGISAPIPHDPPPGGVRIVSTADITKDGRLLYSQIRTIAAPEKTVKRLTLRTGDVLFNWRNSAELIGKTAVFEEQSDPHVFASFVLRIECDERKTHNFFLSHLLNHWREKGVFVRLSRRAVNQANYNRNEISALKIPLPPYEEQREIARVLLGCGDAISATNQENLMLDELFRAMLEQLMTDRLSAAPLTREYQPQ